MKLSHLLLFCITILSACNFRNTTEFTIHNENDYAIDITVKTNNCDTTYANIKPKSELITEYDWTDIEKQDGQWIFVVKNSQNRGADSFAHGYFIAGELASFAELHSTGNQLKVRISE
ncbi:MAG: hypothetical protein IPI46_07695 [Bacteroidetes bacterium]|nr:hypothetical protein [Bacteroidota bacterium]